MQLDFRAALQFIFCLKEAILVASFLVNSKWAFN